MYRGDRSRKETLVNYGFRLPSALDNRPLTSNEFRKAEPDGLCVRHPGRIRARKAEGVVVEQVIRPTGLSTRRSTCGPHGQVDDLLHEVRETVAKGSGCW